ncbi:hypothetical protein BBJ28_00004304 [Nothophytophthora sp. Chile5]|nr:hypothetical protein BBJ28_00004304 [Nothophytophthora sp. Chile5]
MEQNARLWPDEADRPWRTSVKSNDLELLLVSQFTLHGYFSGNKPDFHLSSRFPIHQFRQCRRLAPEPAKIFFDAFCERVRREHIPDKVAEGVFGAYMEVSIVRTLA